MNNHITKYLCGLALLGISFGQSNAQNWQSLGSGMNWPVRTLYADTIANILYAGGVFAFADSIEVDGIAQWDGTQWDSLGTGMDTFDGGNQIATQANVLDMIRYNGKLYAGGAFSTMGGIVVNGIAVWDGVQWDSIPGIANTAVWGLFVHDNELYATGSFSQIGGISASKIGKYDGTSWSNFPVLEGLGGGWAITCGIFYKDELYVGGNFPGTSGPNMADIAKWNGAAWQPVSSGFTGFNTNVNTFAVYNDHLYVGGYFWEADGDPGNCIAKWDGSNWSTVGTGVDGQVMDMQVYQNELYVVGQFTDAGGVPVSYIAKWNDTAWCSLGSSLDNVAGSIAVLNDTLYIAGGFNVIDGDSINYTAQWAVGNYTDSCLIVNSIIKQTKSEINNFNIYPNPTTGLITLTNLPKEFSRVTIYNVLGELVHVHKLNGLGEQTIDLSDLSDGVYLIQLQDGQTMRRIRAIKQ